MMARDASHVPGETRVQRRAAMRQALVGLAVLVPLLLALPFLGYDDRAPEAVPSTPAVSSAPEPAVTMPIGGIAPTSPVSPAPQLDAPPTPGGESATLAASLPETPPDPAPAQTAVGAAQEAVGSAPAAEEPAVAAVPPAVAERRYPPPPPGNGYMVQLGVFADTENAAKLLLELAAAGHPVYLQSRVVLGPYPDKAAAQRAQEKIRRERKLDGMIVPPRKP